MCDYGSDVKVQLCEPDENGKEVVKVDRCLAALVQMLNLCGVKTISSCCGHDKNHYATIRIHSKNILINRHEERGSFTVHLRVPYEQLQ